MRVKFISFGKKYSNVDTTEFNTYYDVRFLKNPYWDPKLKVKSGLDKDVQDYILKEESSKEYIKSVIDSLRINLKAWTRSEEYVVGVACTGGRHRSVTLVEVLYEEFKNEFECIKEHKTIDYTEESYRKETGNYKPKVVCLGGGTGLSNLLKGLNKFPVDLTAIVAVSDSGGSTKDIRKWFEMPAPGDIRRVLLSMSSKKELFEELFNFRFTDKNKNLINNHTVGNIVLAALNEMNNGHFINAVDQLCDILEINGRVLPISKDSLHIGCNYTDGTQVISEELIPNKNKEIKDVFYSGEAFVNKDAVEAILSADLVVLSSGSLYTSLLPNLLFEEVKDALKRSRGKVVYVSNVTTQKGETLNYDLEKHVSEIENTIGKGILKDIIANNNFEIPSSEAKENFDKAKIDFVRINKEDERYKLSNLINYKIEEESNHVIIQHNSDKVGYILFKTAFERLFGYEE